MRLEVIDDRHIKTSLLLNNEIVKTKKFKGRIVNNYFEFHTNHVMFTFFLNVFVQQSNRLALSKEGDLYADNNYGGGAFLIFIPVPLSFSSDDKYNLKFKRREKSN